jgi:HemY protein
MRLLAAFLLIAALAVGFALLARSDVGYVQFTLPPLRVEMSFFVFVLATFAAFIALYGVLRLAARVAAMPREVRAHRVRAQLERARQKQDAALVALLEGRYGRARELADETLALPRSGGLPALIGARAALDMRDFAGAEALLARSDARVPSLDVPRLMLEAELALEQGRAGEALAKLDDLRREAGSHTAALRLSLARTQRGGASRRSAGGRRPARPPQGLRRRAGRHGSRERPGRAARGTRARRGEPEGRVGPLGEADRLHPKIALAAAESYARLGGDREAVDIVARSLEREWNASLVALFGELRPADASRQLEMAERWLPAHRDDAVLLRTLGRLCERAGLWGKAQSYYEASLAVDDHWRARAMLGGLFLRLGRVDDANAQLAAALRLALAELGAPGLAPDAA